MIYLAEFENGDILKIESRKLIPDLMLLQCFKVEAIREHIRSFIKKIYTVDSE